MLKNNFVHWQKMYDVCLNALMQLISANDLSALPYQVRRSMDIIAKHLRNDT